MHGQSERHVDAVDEDQDQLEQYIDKFGDRRSVMTRIAIIGAGLSGLVLAKKLKSRARVTVFEKSRGAGGRMATRYANPWHFDHGAQFFTAKSEPFKSFIEPLAERGIVANWEAAFVELDRSRVVGERQWDASYPHYVATPGMNQLGKHLAAGVDVRLQTRVGEIRHKGDAWQIFGEDRTPLGEADWVVSTAPAAQTAGLLPTCFTHADTVNGVRMLGCYALMLGFGRAPPLSFQAALVHNADISWISVNSSKPGRPGGGALLVHSTNAWADAHMEDELEAVQAHLLQELADVIGHDVGAADHCALHRWRYANMEKRSGEAALVDAENRLAACGDWCVQGRVEGAFTSAIALLTKLAPLL